MSFTSKTITILISIVLCCSTSPSESKICEQQLHFSQVEIASTRFPSSGNCLQQAAHTVVQTRAVVLILEKVGRIVLSMLRLSEGFWVTAR